VKYSKVSKNNNQKLVRLSKNKIRKLKTFKKVGIFSNKNKLDLSLFVHNSSES
jgi:hypothetical protein